MWLLNDFCCYVWLLTIKALYLQSLSSPNWNWEQICDERLVCLPRVRGNDGHQLAPRILGISTHLWRLHGSERTLMDRCSQSVSLCGTFNENNFTLTQIEETYLKFFNEFNRLFIVWGRRVFKRTGGGGLDHLRNLPL